MPLLRRTALLAPAALIALALPASASAIPANTWVATDNGACDTANNTFTVPAGITSVHVKLDGADGRQAGVYNDIGFGAEIEADVAVTPGDTLKACLGVGGGAAGDSNSGAGGGFASIARGANKTDLLLLAAGGGGAGGQDMGVGTGIGTDGTLPGAFPLIAPTQGNAHGGMSGTNSGYGIGGVNTSGSPANNGTPGAQWLGGHGGAGGGNNGGGGGGGGYYGGGGGAGSLISMDNGAGGGGGGSYCVAACNAVVRDAVLTSRDAVVKITWVSAPALELSGDGNYGSVELGSSATRTFTVKNTGSGTMNLTSFGMPSGDPSHSFGFGNVFTCGATLAPGAECQIEVKFTPTTPGDHNVTFQVTADGNLSKTIAITAFGGSKPADTPTETPVSTDPPVTGGPAPTPTTPAPTACVSRRVVNVAVPSKRVVSAKASIAGKTVASLKKGKLQVDLTGRAAGKVKVTYVVKLRGGKTVKDVRTYTTCAAKH